MNTNKNGYTLYMTDVYGNVINDVYKTYECAYCTMVSRAAEAGPHNIVEQYVMDNDTGEILFTKDKPEHYFIVIWQDDDVPGLDYEMACYIYEEMATNAFIKCWLLNMNSFIIEMRGETVISYDNNGSDEWGNKIRDIFEC